MFDRPIVAFDLETIPDPEVGRRHYQLEGDDEAVLREMLHRRLDETNGASEYPPHPWQRVVCACATILTAEGCTIRALGGAALDERSHLEGVFRLGAERSPEWVSWNGRGFDLPVLRYRAMALGVAAPGFHAHADAHHVDLMHELSSHGASPRAGLSSVSTLLGLPNKRFTERPVYEHYLAGEHDRIVDYCKLDTVDTLLVFLSWAHHEGRLDEAAFARSVAHVRDAVRREPAAGWRPIEAELARWPRWLMERR